MYIPPYNMIKDVKERKHNGKESRVSERGNNNKH